MSGKSLSMQILPKVDRQNDNLKRISGRRNESHARLHLAPEIRVSLHPAPEVHARQLYPAPINSGEPSICKSSSAALGYNVCKERDVLLQPFPTCLEWCLVTVEGLTKHPVRFCTLN